MRPRRWVVAGGGTGGHVTPALALAERIVARGDSVRVLGSQRGLETRLVPAAGFELVALPARQLVGKRRLAQLRTLVTLPAVIFAARSALRRFGAEIVISVGGYAAAPAVLAAATLGLPVALVNTDAVPGRTNLLAARFARRIFVGFERAATGFPTRGDAGRVRCHGIPLRRALVQAFASDATPRRAPGRPLRLLVFGGSQGARQINEVMIEVARAFAQDELSVVHQSGEADRERVAAAYAASGLRSEVIAFEPEMPRRYREADIALCRAGALTVAELALAGLPALLVPYPFAAHDEQSANAAALVEAGAAVRLDPHALRAEDVIATLRGFLAEPARLGAMSAAARRLARPDAAERIIEDCSALLG